MAKQFEESLLANLVHTVFICAFFYLMQVPRSSLQVFIKMFCFLFFCLAAVTAQVNTANKIQYI